VPETTGRTVYRVAQEALTNVHKHARDAATTVRLSGAPGEGLVVEVVNVRPVSADDLQPGAGVGLVGLRERVDLAGGTLEAGPTPAGGWRVRAWFPWPTP
jgi:signal transduction histidine kinase